jgi:hypothetical protein
MFSEDTLRDMAPHIAWEFSMFDLAACETFYSGPKVKSDAFGTTVVVMMSSTIKSVQHRTVDRLVFEAFLIHFRNLLDFFYGKRTHRNDILVSDYQSNWVPNRPLWESTDRQRCNKLLAHITSDRLQYLKDGTIEWSGLTEKHRHIRTEWNAFLQSLPPERLNWFTHPTDVSW